MKNIYLNVIAITYFSEQTVKIPDDFWHLLEFGQGGSIQMVAF